MWGYFSLCLWKCTFRLPLVEKRFPQMLHLKGSPIEKDSLWPVKWK